MEIKIHDVWRHYRVGMRFWKKIQTTSPPRISPVAHPWHCHRSKMFQCVKIMEFHQPLNSWNRVMLLQFTANHPRSLLSWRMCPCDITTSPSSPFISKDWAEKSSFSSTHLRKLGSCHMSEDFLQTKFHTKVDWSLPTWKSSKCQQMKKLSNVTNIRNVRNSPRGKLRDGRIGISHQGGKTSERLAMNGGTTISSWKKRNHETKSSPNIRLMALFARAD